MKKPFITNCRINGLNPINGLNREKPLDSFQFLVDLESVFKKHEVNVIKDGFVGFNKDGVFGIDDCHLDIHSKGIKF